MSTRAKVASAVASAGILLIGWQAATNGREAIPAETPEVTTVTPTPPPSTVSPVEATISPVPPTASPVESTVAPVQRSEPAVTTAAPSSSKSTGKIASQYADGTFTGAPSSNRFGSWTVTIKIADGQINDVTAGTTANDSRSQSINDWAVPELRAAVLEAQSTRVNTISGATLTSNSYLESLQSALDQAAA